MLDSASYLTEHLCFRKHVFLAQEQVHVGRRGGGFFPIYTHQNSALQCAAVRTHTDLHF